MGYIAVVGSSFKIAGLWLHLAKAISLDLYYGRQTLILQSSALQAAEQLNASFWKCFLFPLPSTLQTEPGFISFGIAMSLEGKKKPIFKRELPDFK